MNNTPRFMLTSGYNVDSEIHIVKTSVRARIDAMIQILMMLMIVKIL